MAAVIGFVGLGAMGAPMVARLAGAGHALQLLDADATRAATLAATHGASVAADAAALAENCDTIVSMLPNSAVVGTVLDAALPKLRPGALVIEMSSGSPTATKALAARVAAAGGTLIDTPVSGGVPRAIDGTLAIMAGGDAAAIDRAEPLLRAMGSSVTRTGPVGSAHAMKALNNLVSAGGFLIGIEALLIGQRFGLDPGTMVDVLNASSGMNNSTQRKFRQFVLNRGFNAGFGLDLMVKDLSIALEVARDSSTPAPFAAHCREMWAASAAMLGPGRDHTELARLCESLAGSELGRS
jgi:3-hydroxyisobutyrate dehydrogenase